MAPMQEFEERLFSAVNQTTPLKDFESWLYANQSLPDMMDQPLVFTAYEFNYNRKDAISELKKELIKHVPPERFINWKIKDDLRALASRTGSSQRILNDFMELCEQGYPFLKSISYYEYELEDLKYLDYDPEKVWTSLIEDALELLQAIEKWQQHHPEMDLCHFTIEENHQASRDKAKSRKDWWNFWK